jgi:hypothetical protein
MKLATIALASAFALSSTFALAYTGHHRTYHHGYHGYHGTVGMSSARTPGRSMRTFQGGNGTAGGPTSLVGGSDPGTYKP